MALRMDRVAVEFADAVENCDYVDSLEYASDVTDAASDEECAVTPRGVERVGPRSSKRTYGVFVADDAVPERRVQRRLDVQIELLRTVIPNSRTDEKPCVLTDAYEYIATLKRQVQELHYELDTESCSNDDDVSSYDDDESSCEDDASSCDNDGLSPSCAEEERPLDSISAFEWSSASRRGRSRSRVEVLGTRAGLRIRVECDERAGLLDEVMSVLESRGLIVEQATVSFEERFALDCIASLVDRKRAVECRHVGARLRSVIADH